jgi:hypothetical protein
MNSRILSVKVSQRPCSLPFRRGIVEPEQFRQSRLQPVDSGPRESDPQTLGSCRTHDGRAIRRQYTE